MMDIKTKAVNRIMNNLHYLNSALIDNQQLEEQDVIMLASLHARREILFEQAGQEFEEYSAEQCQDAVDRLEQLEYRMQLAWGFTPDSNYHTWWYKMPGCKCPEMDNAELVGTSTRIFNSECKFHGNGKTST